MYKIDELIEGIARTHNPTVAGLDTRLEQLPPAVLSALGYSVVGEIPDARRAAEAILFYNNEMIAALRDIVPAVKVQIACYELLGAEGVAAFAATLRAAREAGLVVIADAKRNDIGATAQCYSSAFIGGSALPGGERAFESDFVTVNPYLGIDGVQPFMDDAQKYGTGIFALVKTSNKSSGQLQDVRTADGRTVYELVGDLVSEWGGGLIGEHGYSSIGAVVGATWPQQGAELRARLKHTFFLVPGYGAQGAGGRDIAGCFDAHGSGAIVNASRSLLTAWKKHADMDWKDALRAEALAMREDLNANIGV